MVDRLISPGAHSHPVSNAFIPPATAETGGTVMKSRSTHPKTVVRTPFQRAFGAADARHPAPVTNRGGGFFSLREAGL